MERVRMEKEEKLELEDHFILRLPQSEAAYIRKLLHKKPKKVKTRLSLDLNPKSGKGCVYVRGKRLEGCLKKLPTISETYKTYDGNCFTKTADVCDVFDCSNTVTSVSGLTPPLKNVKKKRFRKCRINKDPNCINVHKEVCYLLQADYEAVSSSFQLIDNKTTTTTTTSNVADDNNNEKTSGDTAQIALFGNVLTDSEGTDDNVEEVPE